MNQTCDSLGIGIGPPLIEMGAVLEISKICPFSARRPYEVMMQFAENALRTGQEEEEQEYIEMVQLALICNYFTFIGRVENIYCERPPRFAP